MKTFLATLATSLALALPARAEAAEGSCAGPKQRLVLVGIRSADEAVRGLLPVLDDEYAAALQATGCFEMFSATDLSVSLQFDGLRAELGCNDDTCRARLDRELKRVDLVAAGELRATPSGHQLSLVLLDAESRTSVNRYGPTPPTRSEVEHKSEIRKGARILVGLKEELLQRNDLLAVMTLRDPQKSLETARAENLTTVLYTTLAQDKLVTLVPRDQVLVLEQQLRDPGRVAREARARYLLESELVVLSSDICDLAGTLYDLDRGITRVATRVRGGCRTPQLAESADGLARKIIQELKPKQEDHLLGWISAGTAVAAGTVGAIFFAGAVDDIGTRNAASTLESFEAADQSAQDKMLVSNIGFAVAGAAAAAALTYLIVELVSGDNNDDKAAWMPLGNGALVQF